MNYIDLLSLLRHHVAWWLNDIQYGSKVDDVVDVVSIWLLSPVWNLFQQKLLLELFLSVTVLKP